ncbi:putative cat eye syndrome critical region protein 5-like [Apostichopus japonicus]|uniref:Putative cat eye syndrome critical region protein 5-like n=1 Tax=Stichopus japonicus TaxID=307972 RepID=A0A2G8K334_STIJA|nr:putative cat eye syndrome critical region protein 5-like [Apostichopus japonicus]
MNGTAAMQNTFRVSRVICRSHEPTRQVQYCRFSSSDTNVTEVKKPHFGLLFDIDGVLVRGKRLLPQAVEAFRKISAFNPKANRRELTVPTVFVTNAGNALRQTKARQLSEWLGVHVSESQVVMSHSPLKILPQFHDKHVLVSGQGPVKDIARGLGFKKITTIDELSDMFPQLDAVDHKRRTNTPQSELGNYLAPIEALILFGEPVRWETALQFMIDVLVTNGRLQSSPKAIPEPHLPVLGCNMDLMWMNETHLPRFGHGSFLVCLETLYQGNPMTDIYGANLYNQYLSHRGIKRLKNTADIKSAIAQQSTMRSPNGHSGYVDKVDITFGESAEMMESVLVPRRALQECRGGDDRLFRRFNGHRSRPPRLQVLPRPLQAYLGGQKCI